MGRSHLPGAQGWALIEADAVKALPRLAARSVDAVVTDPPYGIDFGGARWDGRDIRDMFAGLPAGEAFERWTGLWAAECLRVLKPGGHLLAFGSPRTAHRLAAGLEDAGFELRDTLMWLYGQGVPKDRLRDGRASQLKPGYEPVLLARAPLQGSISKNEAMWGTGRLGIDESRLPPDREDIAGRWPANVAITHTDACATVCTPDCPVLHLDCAQPATRPSRFFYCAKPSRQERDSGCDHLPARKTTTVYGMTAAHPRRNTHPTVKPVALMAWLIKLACPPGGTVLDPFTGSGTTGVATLQAQRRFIGVERDSGYARIARARLRHAATHTRTPGSGGG